MTSLLAPRALLRAASLACLCLAARHAPAQPHPSAPDPLIEQLRQQERERTLREQQERTVDSRLQKPEPTEARRLPEREAPCRRIERIVLGGELAERFQWAVDAADGDDDAPLGRCLGTEGINIVLARMQRAVIARGYVTTRVLAGSQDLTTGTLVLTLVPGRIAAIRASDGGAPFGLRAAIPAAPGDLLNIRDIEQGLENLKRVPTADADIRIEPSAAAGARPGDSDLVVRHTQSRRLRGGLSLDDSGTRATGRYQGALTLSGDNLLGLNDLFYVSANHSVSGRHFLWRRERATEGQTVHYSLPWGRWLLGFTASNARYRQSVAGMYQDYVYAGKSSNAQLQLSRLVWRDQRRKTTVSLRAWRRETRNAIDDTEIEVQHRVTGGWELGLNHREFIGAATLDASLAYRRGTGGLGAFRVPEEASGEGTSRLALASADVSLDLPFRLGGQKLRYAGLWRAQWNRTPLAPQERFAIGGRYTVRGFDGEHSLMGERGWLLRSDLGWALGESGAELYLGLDCGRVGGPSVRQLAGRRLAGGVVGVRGAWRGVGYDFFTGAPIRKPGGFDTARVTAGFNLNYSF